MLLLALRRNIFHFFFQSRIFSLVVYTCSDQEMRV